MPKKKKEETQQKIEETSASKSSKNAQKTIKAEKSKILQKLSNLDKNKIIKLGVVLAVIIALAYTLADQIVPVTVNGAPITRWELIKELEKRGGAQTLDSLVTEELIKQEARKQNIQITQQEIDVKIEEIRNSLTTQGLTLEQALEQEGLTMEDLTQDIILQVQLEKMVAEEIAVTDEEVQQYIEQNQDVYENATDEQLTQVRQILQQSKLSQATNNLVTQLRQDAAIRYLKEF